ncbi:MULTISPECIES: sigma-70 family RNA polymerase sigma factor [Arenibacter]|uniref:sigma-70 family RNA polymerase sigma factor n=1 Tax=Arenibacter TaxID=178469 RepID=UPI001FF3A769|nr:MULTISPECIES: sigma-70 family RNA polymerase sigma factor [Arenibacter]MCK0136128.1 sigma-70 family RNA polymerase sigma factor [Arenibacter sp. S6351L]
MGMKIETAAIWKKHHSEIYFFILKKVKDEEATREIIQNAFLKIHQKIDTLKDSEKVRAWVFTIVRNEIANYYNLAIKTLQSPLNEISSTYDSYQDFCCFDRFVTNLPKPYKEVVHLVYLQGKTQGQAAEMMGISLANVKARIRRAKSLLIHNFNACCKFEINNEGKLVGDSNCSICN